MTNVQMQPYIKINSRDNDIRKVIGREIETKLSGIYIYIPGEIYYIVSGDDTCGKYATKIISVTIDEDGTRIIHEPFECTDNVYNSGISTASSGRNRFRLDD